MRKKPLILSLLAHPRTQVLFVLLAALVVCMLMPVAFAQGTTSQSSGYGTTGNAFLQAWGLTLGTLLSGGIFGAIRTWTSRLKSTQLQDVLQLIETLAHKKVQEIIQSSINHLKAASEDGKLTPLEAKRALLTAIEEVWESLPAALRSLLIGFAGDQNTAKGLYLRPIIEAAVQNVNAAHTVFSPSKRPNEAVLTAARKRIGL